MNTNKVLPTHSVQSVQQIWESKAKNWAKLTSPWRPSAGDIAVYESSLQTNRRGNVLVLGATPELRDLVARVGDYERIFVADQSIAMLQAGSELLTYATPEKEVWLKSDWSRLHFLEPKFDVVLGDMIWWVLSVEQQSAILRVITNLLKSNGIFVSRFRFQNEACRSMDLATTVALYSNKYLQNHIEKSRIQNEMLSDLYDVSANEVSKRLSRERVMLSLKKAVQQTSVVLVREFLTDAMNRLVGDDWTVQTRAEVLMQLSETFSPVGEAAAGDYASQYYPVITHTKRESI